MQAANERYNFYVFFKCSRVVNAEQNESITMRKYEKMSVKLQLKEETDVINQQLR